jgi:hypothetical protein
MFKFFHFQKKPKMYEEKPFDNPAF